MITFSFLLSSFFKLLTPTQTPKLTTFLFTFSKINLPPNSWRWWNNQIRFFQNSVTKHTNSPACGSTLFFFQVVTLKEIFIHLVLRLISPCVCAMWLPTVFCRPLIFWLSLQISLSSDLLTVSPSVSSSLSLPSFPMAFKSTHIFVLKKIINSRYSASCS